MARLAVSDLLRLGLRVDAAVSAAAGVLTLFLASPLQLMLGMPPAAVAVLGGFMLGYGLLIGWLSSLAQLPPAVVWSVVLGNVLWVAGSVWLSFSGLIAPSTLGLILLLGQALLIAAVTEVQYIGMRRSPSQVMA